MCASGSLLAGLSVLFFAHVVAKPGVYRDSFQYAVHGPTAGTEVISYIRETPKYLQACHRSDRQFNLCVKNTLQSFFRSVSNGSLEYDLPINIEPLIVPKMRIVQGSGDVSLDFLFRDVFIVGLSSAKVISVGSNLDIYKLEMSMKYPNLYFFGEFACEGGVKSFPIVGNGHFSFNMTDVTAAWIIYLQETESFESHKYLTIDQFNIDLIPGKISARFGEAIDGDNNLGEVLNTFFNENAQEIFKMTKPKIMEELSGIFGGIANQILSRFPVDTLLPP